MSVVPFQDRKWEYRSSDQDMHLSLSVALGQSFLVYHLFCDFSPSSFCVLNFPSICGLQGVSAPCLVVFFMCPDLSFSLWSTVCECLLLNCFLSVLTCCILCGLQDVSALCPVAFFPCPDLFLPLRSPGCEFSCSKLVALFLCPDLSLLLGSPVGGCTLLGHFCPCPDLSLPLLSLGCEHPSFS